MHKLDINTVFMGLLFTIFVVLGVSFLSELIFHHEAPETKGYKIEVADAGNSDAGAEAAPVEEIGPLLATADIAAGEKLLKRCTACHSFEEGGKNKVGPALYNVVNKAIGTADGFGYSGGLTGYAADKVWSYDELDGFLKKPSKWIKGTAMGFAGLKKIQDRANIIAYMRTLSGSPAPLPAE